MVFGAQENAQIFSSLSKACPNYLHFLSLQS